MAARDVGRSAGLFLARVSLAGIFLYAGAHKLGDLAGTAHGIAKAGYPLPKLLATVVALAELAGGASLLLGFLTTAGCLGLVLLLLPVTYSFHYVRAGGDVGQLVNTLKNVGLMGGLLALAAAGPGGLSLDARLLRRKS